MMSSEISIEEAGRLAAQPATSPTAPAKPDDGFRPWHFFVLTSILLATVAVVLARQSAPEHLILISFTIAAAGAAAGAFYRMLAPLTAPVVLRLGEPVSERMRSALEREKALVLRSIKELEFDRGMGKVSDKDFEEMAGRLRSRAMSLMKQLDLGSAGYADVIEQELRRRGASRAGATGDPGARAGSRALPACACGTANDPDAVFCKACGTRLARAGAQA
jgi:hypothetical protein